MNIVTGTRTVLKDLLQYSTIIDREEIMFNRNVSLDDPCRRKVSSAVSWCLPLLQNGVFLLSGGGINRNDSYPSRRVRIYVVAKCLSGLLGVEFR